MAKLLSRDDFRNGVFARDHHACVWCGRPAVDAHHIMERALWKQPAEKEGYFMDNGASLCEEHHKAAELNHLSPEACRHLIHATERLIPAQLDPDKAWNKWGEELRRPTRDGDGIKYPSTSFFPFSPTTDHGQILESCNQLLGVPLVTTVKMDGANAKLTRTKVAARNGDTADSKMFSMLKAIHAGIKDLIPDNVAVFIEWLYAKHSIKYEGQNALDSYINVICAYDFERELFLSWRDTVKLAETIGYPTVPVIGEGEYKAEWQLYSAMQTLAHQAVSSGHEGIVARSAYPVHYGQFENYFAKYVREGHNQMSAGWKPTEVNQVK